MEELYKRTIQAIIDLDSKPTKKEWAQIAKEYGFLSPTSVSRIYGKTFTELCIEIRKKRNKKA